MPEQAPLTPVEFCCTGYSLSPEHKEIVGIKEVKDGQIDGSPQLWLLRKDFRLNPGNVYLISTTEERTKFGKNVQWARMWADSLEAIEMQMRAKAFDSKRAADRLAKKEGSPTKKLEDTLRPVKNVYQAMSFADQVAFEVWLLRYLHRAD